jgi:modulator of FtsH protease
MYQEEQTAYQGIQPTYFSQVIFYFGLAILSSALGTYVGFAYLIPFFMEIPMLMWILFAVELVLIFTSRAWSVKRPINYFFFALFSFITGVTLVPLLASIIILYGGPGLIIKALLATVFMFSAAALFGWVTKIDLSGLRGFLWISLLGMIVISVIGIFVPWGSTFEMFFSGFGVILFSAYTIYDFQQIKRMPFISPMDTALRLYLDIFNLFLFILRLLSAGRD